MSFTYTFIPYLCTAHCFLLVYAIDSKESFEQVKCCFEDIRENRSDFQEVPIIIVGNKADLPTIKRDVEFDEVCDWIHDHLPKIRWAHVLARFTLKVAQRAALGEISVTVNITNFFWWIFTSPFTLKFSISVRLTSFTTWLICCFNCLCLLTAQKQYSYLGCD